MPSQSSDELNPNSRPNDRRTPVTPVTSRMRVAMTYLRGMISEQAAGNEKAAKKTAERVQYFTELLNGKPRNPNTEKTLSAQSLFSNINIIAEVILGLTSEQRRHILRELRLSQGPALSSASAYVSFADRHEEDDDAKVDTDGSVSVAPNSGSAPADVPLADGRGEGKREDDDAKENIDESHLVAPVFVSASANVPPLPPTVASPVAAGAKEVKHEHCADRLFMVHHHDRHLIVSPSSDRTPEYITALLRDRSGSTSGSDGGLTRSEMMNRALDAISANLECQQELDQCKVWFVKGFSWGDEISPERREVPIRRFSCMHDAFRSCKDLGPQPRAWTVIDHSMQELARELVQYCTGCESPPSHLRLILFSDGEYNDVRHNGMNSSDGFKHLLKVAEDHGLQLSIVSVGVGPQAPGMYVESDKAHNREFINGRLQNVDEVPVHVCTTQGTDATVFDMVASSDLYQPRSLTGMPRNAGSSITGSGRYFSKGWLDTQLDMWGAPEQAFVQLMQTVAAGDDGQYIVNLTQGTVTGEGPLTSEHRAALVFITSLDDVNARMVSLTEKLQSYLVGSNGDDFFQMADPGEDACINALFFHPSEIGPTRVNLQQALGILLDAGRYDENTVDWESRLVNDIPGGDWAEMYEEDQDKQQRVTDWMNRFTGDNRRQIGEFASVISDRVNMTSFSAQPSDWHQECFGQLMLFFVTIYHNGDDAEVKANTMKCWLKTLGFEGISVSTHVVTALGSEWKGLSNDIEVKLAAWDCLSLESRTLLAAEHDRLIASKQRLAAMIGQIQQQSTQSVGMPADLRAAMTAALVGQRQDLSSCMG